MNYTFNLTYSDEGKIIVNDIIHNVCNQYGSYIKTLGFVIIGFYILVTLGGWWFWNKGYKLLPSTKTWVGDLNDINVRIKLDYLFRSIALKWAVGYIVVVIWLSWGF